MIKNMLINFNIRRGARFSHFCRFFSQDLADQQKNDQTIIVEKIGPITTIGINRPEKRNCINMSTAKLLREVLLNFEEDSSSTVGILHGIGGNFCAGEDLDEISKLKKNSSLLSETPPDSSPIGIPLRLIKKPLIAAISGYAVGAGFELSLMCDLRVIEETAVMGLYQRRFGVPCMNGGTVRLSSMVGLSRSLDLLLTGRSLSADEAFQWGLANRIVACGTALGQAMQFAGSLVKFPQECLLEDRKNLYSVTFNDSLQVLLELEKNNGFKVFNEESIEGAKKFIDSGIGRHGKTYHLKKKDLPDWEKD